MGRRYETDYLPNKYFLFGELNVFMNRVQAAGDQFLPEISEEDIVITKKTISAMDRNLVEISRQRVAD